MRKMILPPDAFDEMPDGYLHSTEPDDGDREEHEFPFPEFDDYADRVAMELKYDAEERFAELMELNERAGAA